MGLGGKVLRVGALSGLIVAVSFGGWFAYQSRTQEEHFCLVGLAFVRIDGQDVILQDQSPPGPDRCDGKETSGPNRVLGLDCKIREPNGDVVKELKPNRPDGTCGLFDPGDGAYPGPWPTGD